jgi:bifunctional oligoribonuclease and PAP phosphatase NrnA
LSATKQIDRTKEFQKLLDLLKSKNDFILTTHKGSDPDGIGSELGLSFLLSNLKKSYQILNPDKIPDKYEFIDVNLRISHLDESSLQNFDQNKTVIIVDNSDIPRIGEVQKFIKPDKSNLMIIDHHDNIEPFEGLFFFPEIGSTCEIIYELIELADLQIDYNTAVAIYLGIVMDTGQFKYSKTRPRTHQIAAKLLELNFLPEDLVRKLYEDFPTNVLLLKKDIYSNVEIHEKEKLVSIEITKEMLSKYHYTINPLDGIVSEFLGPKSVKVSVSFTEFDIENVKISLRSKGNYDICAIAKKFGGGGHKNASGAMIRGNLKSVKSEVLNELYHLIKTQKD